MKKIHVFLLSLTIILSLSVLASLDKLSLMLQDSPLNPKMKPFYEVATCDGLVADYYDCLYPIVRKQLEEYSPLELLSIYDKLSEKNRDVRKSCHLATHAIGKLVFEKEKTVFGSFKNCTNACFGGCHHGVLQEFFFEGEENEEHSFINEDLLQKKMYTLCPFSHYHELHPCSHGAGHGLQQIFSNNLEKALEFCDYMPDKVRREICYDGVFMENIWTPDRSTWKINFEDPHYPCNSVEEKYKYMCYYNQPYIAIEIFNGDLDRLIRFCEEAGNYSYPCFHGVGKDLSVTSPEEGPIRDEFLKKLKIEQQKPFIHGILHVIDDVTDWGVYSFPYCDSFEDKELLEWCYNKSVAGYPSIYHQVRKQACFTYSANKLLCYTVIEDTL